MTKDKIKGIALGTVLGLSLATTPALAKIATEAINVSYNNIKIYMDGTLVEPKDANGNAVEPFIYNGTTYLPVRAVGEAIGKEVNWDAATSSVYLGAKTATETPAPETPAPETAEATYLVPYQFKFPSVFSEIYVGGESRDTFKMSGVEHNQGFTIAIRGYEDLNEAYIALDGKYDKLSFEIGYLDSDAPSNDDIVVEFYVDGRLIKTLDDSFVYVNDVELDVTSGKLLTVKVIRGVDYTFTMGVANIKAE